MPDINEAITNLTEAFSLWDSTKYALIVAVFVAICSSLLGVTLVLKRFSFIGDGLSHVAFGATTVATVMGFIPANQMNTNQTNTYITLGVTMICAVLILRTKQNAKIKGDAAIAMISVGSLAFGYLLMNIANQLHLLSNNNVSTDVCSTLFGSGNFYNISLNETILYVVLSSIVILSFILLYNKIFAITFDEDFANATGTRANTYNLILAILIAVIVVISMKFVGSLLISALIIFPALSAMRIFKSFLRVTIFSVMLSIICTTSGFILSLMFDTPVGSTIVAIDVFVFLICFAMGKLFGGIKR